MNNAGAPPLAPTLTRRIGFWSGLVAFALIAYAPLGASPSARRGAAALALLAIWWISEALPLAVTALAPIVVFPWLGVMSAAETCREYGHHLIFLFLAGFLLAEALARWGLDRRLAYAVVAIVGDRPRQMVLGVMIATAFISMWVNNTATAALMLPVGLALVKLAESSTAEADATLDLSPGSFRFASAMMLGIAYAASIGGVGTLVGTAPNALMAALLEEHAGVKLTFARYLAVGLPLVLFLIPTTWAWLTFVAFPPEVRQLTGGGAALAQARAALGPLGHGARRTVIVALLAALGWTTRPVWEPALLGRSDALEDAGIGIVVALLLFAIPSGEPAGGPLLSSDALRRVPWETLLLFGGGLALARGIEKSGFASAIGDAAASWVWLPLPLFVVLLCVATVVLTEFASNTATAAIILPLFAAVAKTMGVPPAWLMIPAGLAASMGFMMPVGTPPNAMVFGTRYVTMRQMVWGGLAIDLLAIAGIALLSLTVVRWLW